MKKKLILICLSGTFFFHSCLGIEPLGEDDSTAIVQEDSSPNSQAASSDAPAIDSADASSDVSSPESEPIAPDVPASDSQSAALNDSASEGQTTAGLSALHVDGAKLVDAAGTPVQLRGISTHGLSWFPEYVNEDCFRNLHEDWNANIVRLAMYTAEYNGYCTGNSKEELKNLIHDGVTYATNENMYVIIDWHILSDGNPNQYLNDAKDFWAEMSAAYAQHDNVLFEICNEPNGSTSWADIKDYANEIIPIIRGNGAENVILVGTPNWSQEVTQAAYDPLTGYDNIMYTLHFYAATHTDDLRQKLSDAVNAGLPVFVSEFGICGASGSGAIDTKQADKWISLLDSYDISYVAWNLSNKDETSALLKSDCDKTSGFTVWDLSLSGSWLYEKLCSYESVISGK